MGSSLLGSRGFGIALPETGLEDDFLQGTYQMESKPFESLLAFSLAFAL